MLTRRETLEHVWKTSGKKPKSLAEHEDLDEDIIYLWNWFGEVCCDNLSFTELDAWQRCTGTKLEPFEAVAIRQLGIIRNQVAYERSRNKRDKAEAGG